MLLEWERRFYKLRLRVRSLLQRGRVEQELDDELRNHLEHIIERERARGLSDDAARHAAARIMGGLDQHKEASRDARGLNGIDELARDFRHGFRLLRRNPGFALVTVLTLALGIGANSTLFSLIDAVLLRDLPVQQANQLYFLNRAGAESVGGAPPYPYLQRVRAQTRVFSGSAAFEGAAENLVIDGRAEQAFAHYVSGSYFDVLGVRPVLGRVLHEEDEGLAAPAVVLSYGYWQRRFGGAPTVIGQVLRLGDKAITVVGVTGPAFSGLVPGHTFDVALPLTLRGSELLSSNDTWWLDVVVRLAPGVNALQAQAAADNVFQSYKTDLNISPEAERRRFQRIELTAAQHGLPGLRSRFARPLLILLVVVTLVLGIACANVANLLLARSLVRRREIALRLALGAGVGRVVRQLLTETLLLFLLGAIAGLGFSYWAGRFLANFLAVGRMPLQIDVAVDGPVLAFTAALTLLTMLIFGAVPALRSARGDAQEALKDSRGNSRRSAAGPVLVAIQVAFSLVLLIAAGLFLRTMRNLDRVNPGFQSSGLLTLSVQPISGDASSRQQLWSELLGRVRTLPGVQSASLSVLMPLSGRDRGVSLRVPGFEPDRRGDAGVHQNHVSPDYFRTLRTPVVAGRTFNERDRSGAPAVVLLNQAAARFYFGARNPIGAQVQLGDQTRTVAGVVADAVHNSLREPAPRFVYLPIGQPRETLGRLSLMVRTDGAPMSMLPAVRRQIETVSGNMVISDVLTMQDQIDATLLSERLVSMLAAFFGLLGLLLSALGLYGVVSHGVAGRTREIGIRTALGARPGRVAWLVLRQSLTMVFVGVAIGLPLALAASQPVARLLYGLEPTDSATVVGSVMVLVLVGAAAAWWPARRAARIPPLSALRAE